MIPHARIGRNDHHGRDLYDLAVGPPPPATRRPIAGEWDDPTWISTEVDAAWMADQGRLQVGMTDQEIDAAAIEHALKHRAPDHHVDAVLGALTAGLASLTDLAATTGLSTHQLRNALRWLTTTDRVHRGRRPQFRRPPLFVYWLATPEWDAAWQRERAADQTPRRPQPPQQTQPGPDPSDYVTPDDLLDIIDAGASTRAEIAATTGVPPGDIGRILGALIRSRQLYRTHTNGPFIYRLTAATKLARGARGAPGGPVDSLG